MRHRVIHLEPAAPRKPPPGQACNGCGVCCAAEPCPVGVLASRRRTGACTALAWDAAAARYRCGLVAAPQRHLPPPLRPAAPLLRRWALRAIGAGCGCDCTWEPETAAGDGTA